MIISDQQFIHMVHIQGSSMYLTRVLNKWLIAFVFLADLNTTTSSHSKSSTLLRG